MQIRRITSLTGDIRPINEVVVNQKVGDINRFTSKAGFESVSRFSEGIFAAARAFITKELDELSSYDLILVVSQHVGSVCPPPSAEIFRQFSTHHALVVDINSGCTGFLEALCLMESYLCRHGGARGVIITLDSYPTYSDGVTFAVDGVFGEAVAIVLCESEVGNPLKYTFSRLAEPFNADIIRYSTRQSKLIIDGAGLVEYVRRDVPRCVRNVLTESGISMNDVKHAICHQGSRFIVDALNVGCGTSKFNFESGIFGNTNSSTIPLMIQKLLDTRKVLSGEYCPLLLVAFGVGARSIACIIRPD